MKRKLIILSIFLIGVLPFYFIDVPNGPFSHAIPQIYTLLIVFYLWYQHVLSSEDIGLSFTYNGLEKRSDRVLFTISYGISLFFVNLIVTIGIDNIINPVIPHDQADKSVTYIYSYVERKKDVLSSRLFGESVTYHMRFIVSLVYALLAGIWEEIYFRGLLQKVFDFNKVIYVIVSSVLFGIGHIYKDSIGVTGAIVYGAINAIYYLRIRTLFPAILAHFINNLFIFWWILFLRA